MGWKLRLLQARDDTLDTSHTVIGGLDQSSVPDVGLLHHVRGQSEVPHEILARSDDRGIDAAGRLAASHSHRQP